RPCSPHVRTSGATTSTPTASPTHHVCQSRPYEPPYSATTVAAPTVALSIVLANADRTASPATSRRRRSVHGVPTKRRTSQAPVVASSAFPAQYGRLAEIGCPCRRSNARFAGRTASTSSGHRRGGARSSAPTRSPLGGHTPTNGADTASARPASAAAK